jgi:hypothetical protein
MTPAPGRPPDDTRRALFGLSAYAGVTLLRRFVGWLRKRPPGHKPPLFPRWSNRLFLGALGGAGLTGVAVLGVLLWRAYTPEQRDLVAPAQPVPFSHQIHVTGLQIDCRYCHSSAERASYAGMPATRTCVPCHNDVWLESEAFAPVRGSLDRDLPIPWLRVYDLPDFTYFHHGAHAQAGVGCETCHGRVDRMARIYRAVPLTMGWCLDCHREPENHLRPRSEIATMGYVPERPQEEVGAELKRVYEVTEMTHCTTCHR